MGRVLVKLKVMPSDVEVDVSEIAKKIKNLSFEDVEIKDAAIKPVAFGLKAIYLLAVMPDKEGVIDNFCEEIGKIENVESVSVEDMELL